MANKGHMNCRKALAELEHESPVQYDGHKGTIVVEGGFGTGYPFTNLPDDGLWRYSVQFWGGFNGRNPERLGIYAACCKWDARRQAVQAWNECGCRAPQEWLPGEGWRSLHPLNLGGTAS